MTQTTSGSGGILGGTALGDDGAKNTGTTSVVEQLVPRALDSESQDNSDQTLNGATESALREALVRKESESFASAVQSLRQALQDLPELAELSKNLRID